jgi:hypothetical protein
MSYGIYENGKVIAAFVAPMKVISNKPVFVSDTLSLKRATYARTAQRWEIESNLEPLVDSANDLFVNLVTKGLTETVTILMPQNYGVIKKRTSTATPTAVQASKNSNNVTVTGNNGLIPKGTFIKFANHSKIYMLTEDFKSTSSASMYIYPNLVATVNETFKYLDDVLMSGYYDTTNIVGMSYTDGIMMDMGSVKIVEKL